MQHRSTAVGGPLCRLVAQLCDQLRPQLSPISAARLDSLAGRLASPLQLAVTGRIKSGKSTVVNALIGRRVAPTDIRECTRLVTRFRYGTVDRVEVIRTDGTRGTIPYDASGLVPTDLGTPVDQIAYLDAYLTSALLESVTVIDTPGLGSTDPSSRRRTEAVPAEAMLYVLTQAVRADDAEALGRFQAYSLPQAGSPINAVGLLTKADQLDGPDPMATARALAGSQARALRHRVRTVLPLAGLVAEATETGHFTAADADVLRQLAGLPPTQRDLLCCSADLFVRVSAPIPAQDRSQLLERLDLYGIRQAVTEIVADPGLSTGELRRRLVDRSGFPALRDFIEHAFQRRADGIKASVALAAVEVVATQAPVPSDRIRIRDAVEGLLQLPAAHQLRLLAVATLVSAGTVPMPAELAAELAGLVSGQTPAEQLGAPNAPVAVLRERALQRAGAWRSFATVGSTPAQSRIAHVVHRGYVLLSQQLENDGGSQ